MPMTIVQKLEKKRAALQAKADAKAQAEQGKGEPQQQQAGKQQHEHEKKGKSQQLQAGELPAEKRKPQQQAGKQQQEHKKTGKPQQLQAGKLPAEKCKPQQQAGKQQQEHEAKGEPQQQQQADQQQHEHPVKKPHAGPQPQQQEQEPQGAPAPAKKQQQRQQKQHAQGQPSSSGLNGAGGSSGQPAPASVPKAKATAQKALARKESFPTELGSIPQWQKLGLPPPPPLPPQRVLPQREQQGDDGSPTSQATTLVGSVLAPTLQWEQELPELPDEDDHGISPGGTFMPAWPFMQGQPLGQATTQPLDWQNFMPEADMLQQDHCMQEPLQLQHELMQQQQQQQQLLAQQMLQQPLMMPQQEQPQQQVEPHMMQQHVGQPLQHLQPPQQQLLQPHVQQHPQVMLPQMQQHPQVLPQAQQQHALVPQQQALPEQQAFVQDESSGYSCPLSLEDQNTVLGATAISQIPHAARMRIQQRAGREVESGVLSAQACAEHLAAKGKRDGSQLMWLKQWCNGQLPGMAPVASQVASDLTFRDQDDRWGWFNLNELTKFHGGHLCKEQKAYAKKLWDGAKGRRERPHPEGKHVQRQKQFWKDSDELNRRRRLEGTNVEVAGAVQTPTVLRQLLEGILGPVDGGTAPVRDGASAAGSSGQAADGKPPAKKPRTAEELEADRPSLLKELYHSIPRILAIRDGLPQDEVGNFGRQRLQPDVEKLLQLRAQCEGTGVMLPDTVKAGRLLLRSTMQQASKLHKLCQPAA